MIIILAIVSLLTNQCTSKLICQWKITAENTFLKNQVDNSLNFIFAFCISY
ncbi:hypothetical protein [Salmonella phage vB_SenS_SB10]|uniref:Uncharacterized protein n=1 Tax=Salmonella phage vB_SenS_SB10 TaxID=2591134 RepID=A0A5J6T9B7_9CAUD|nr:hypothetical protein [Salmonella phage vB_SenS_SB10]